MAAARTVPTLYLDDDVLVVDKPSGVLTVEAPDRTGDTLVDIVQREHGRVFPVHRLDEETTGVLVLARTLEAREFLEEIFRTRQSERIYLALLSRVPTPPSGRIEARLKLGDDGVVRADPKGDVAITTYRTLGRRAGGALVACRLQTGRRNQIRAHFAELGAPLCGDRKYGYRSGSGRGSFPRVMLHAWRLAFPHPEDGRRIVAESQPPEEILRPE